MIWDSIESELRCRLAAQAYNYRIPFHRYKLLCEWLDCYQCINPDDRVTFKVEAVVFSPSVAHNLWGYIDLVTVCLTLNEQRLTWQLINES